MTGSGAILPYIQSLMASQNWAHMPRMSERRIELPGFAALTITTPFYALALDFHTWLEGERVPSGTFTLVGTTALTYNRRTCMSSTDVDDVGRPSTTMWCPDIVLINSTAQFQCLSGSLNHYTSLRIIDLTP